MKTEEQTPAERIEWAKNQVNVINKSIDKLGELSILEANLYSEILFFTIYKGEYHFIKTYVESVYKGLHTPLEIRSAIMTLTIQGYITKEIRKIQYEGRYRTVIVLIPNDNKIEELINL